MQIKHFNLAIASTIVFLFLGSFLFIGNELSRAAIFDNSGCMTDGGAFGVRVGDGESSVERRLTLLGLVVQGPEKDQYCGDVRGDEFYYGFDRSWRQGVICVGVIGGHVTSIAWSFMPFAI